MKSKHSWYDTHLSVKSVQLAQWYQQDSGIEVTVVGSDAGRFAITARNLTKKRFILCDENGVPPSIKNPDYLFQLLEEMNIDEYKMDVSVWDVSATFDRHRWATNHRKAKSKAQG